jgi:hypothetical protein
MWAPLKTPLRSQRHAWERRSAHAHYVYARGRHDGGQEMIAPVGRQAGHGKFTVRTLWAVEALRPVERTYLAAEDDSRDDGANADPTKLRFSAEHEGFNLHDGVRIATGDDAGRERLFRYGASPPPALDRLRRLPDGRFASRVKYARAGRAKHRIMTPLELLARIAAILPSPRFRSRVCTACLRLDPPGGKTSCHGRAKRCRPPHFWSAFRPPLQWNWIAQERRAT